MRNLKSTLISFFKDSNRYVSINGTKHKILGRIGMKNFVIDISGCDYKVGEKVKIDINLILCNQDIERIMI